MNPMSTLVPTYTLMSTSMPVPMSTSMPVPIPMPMPTSMQNNSDINNLYINIQDYLDILNSLYDKTKDTFISVNTVLENMKPYIYKKVDKNI